MVALAIMEPTGEIPPFIYFDSNPVTTGNSARRVV